MSTWEAILTGDDAGRAESDLRAIATDLVRCLDLESSPDLLAKIALFYQYLAIGLDDRQYEARADEFSDLAVDRLSSVAMPPHFFGGFADVAWVNEHVSTLTQVAPDDDDDGNEQIDEVLLGLLGRSPWPEGYELIGGLAGYGVYFSEGLPANNSARGLRLVVQRLDELSEQTAEGIRWRTRETTLPKHHVQRYPEGYFNFGVAHGMPSVLVVLCMAAAAGVERERATELADGLVRWIRSRRQGNEDDLAQFPSIWIPGEPPTKSRQAWCYGDPGLAAAWLWAADLRQAPDWKREALGVLRDCAPVTFEDAGIHDAGLCHGAAGLAQIYNRAFQHTHDEVFREAAVRWLKQVMSMRTGSGFGGYQAYQPGDAWTPGVVDPKYLLDEPNFLEGSVGIGLALLAGISTTIPNWDRRLLMAVPPTSS